MTPLPRSRAGGAVGVPEATRVARRPEDGALKMDLQQVTERREQSMP